MTFSETLYFDHQASTPVDKRVFKEMLPFFTEFSGNPHSSDHSIGWEMSEIVNHAKRSVARLIGADDDEIIFTSGATKSNNLAILGIGRRSARGDRRRVLVSAIEHKCVLSAARVLAEQFGFIVELLPVDYTGRVSVSDLENMLDEDVLLVSVMAVNNEIGTIQDIAQLAAAAHKAGAIFHCDAAQAPVAMDVQKLATTADLVSLSAHKMYGPQGVGALFVRRELHCRIEPLMYGGGQQDGLRSGTLPVALCVGMGAAADMLNDADFSSRRCALHKHTATFITQVCTLPSEITLNGPQISERHAGNANLCFHGYSALDILQILQPRLAASTGSACTTGNPETSHVLRAIGLRSEEADASIRFSLGLDTTIADIDEAVELIGGAMRRLSNLAHSA